jgi:hypothetical protein
MVNDEITHLQSIGSTDYIFPHNMNTPLTTMDSTVGLGINLVHLVAQDTLIETPNLQIGPSINPTNNVIKTTVLMASNIWACLDTTTYTIQPLDVNHQHMPTYEIKTQFAHHGTNFDHALSSNYLRCQIGFQPQVGSRLAMVVTSMNCLHLPIRYSSTQL